MQRHIFAVLVSILLLPTTSFAVLICGGDEPLSAKNFGEWPGLVDMVNDPSRVSHCWCNGSWWLSYRGGAAVLNRVLKEFSEVEAVERNVILMPATAPDDGQTAGKKRPTDPPDWRLHVVQGAVRAWHQHHGLESIYDVHPTLWVYISDRTPLNAIKIPNNIKLLQSADIKNRYIDAIANGSEALKEKAKEELQRFDDKIPKDGPAAEEYQSRLTAVEEFVRVNTSEKPTD